MNGFGWWPGRAWLKGFLAITFFVAVTGSACESSGPSGDQSDVEVVDDTSAHSADAEDAVAIENDGFTDGVGDDGGDDFTGLDVIEIGDCDDVAPTETDVVANTNDVGDSGLTDVGESDVGVTPELPHAFCGQPAYDILPTTSVGELVEWEEIPFWSMESAVLDSMLAIAGYTALSPLDYGVTLYRYRYTTQDRGQIVEATSILGVPWRVEMPDTAFPLVIQTHGTTGFSDPCAPSRDERVMEDPAIPAAITAMGFVTVAPDYIGICGFGQPCEVRHAYLNGEQVAIGSWDALRAGLKLLKELGNPVETTTQVVPWGASQGGHAALFVQRYGAYYAPEFDVPATVAMVPPLDLMPLMVAYGQAIGSGTGLFSVSLIALNEWYGNQGDLTDVFTNEEPYFFADSASSAIYPQDQCHIDLPLGSGNVTIEGLFTAQFRQALADGQFTAIEPWHCYYSENSPVSMTPAVIDPSPTLVVLGETDDLVITDLVSPGIDTLCNMGLPVVTVECAGAGHVQASIWSLPLQRDWVRQRIAGIPLDLADVCTAWEPTCCTGNPEGCD